MSAQAGSYDAGIFFSTQGSCTHCARTEHGGLSYNNVANVSRDANGDAYTIQYYPTITAVSPARGSLEGGTEITITGGGFPMDEVRNLSRSSGAAYP